MTIKKEEPDEAANEERENEEPCKVKVEPGEMSTHNMVRLDSDGRKRIYEAPNSETMNSTSECQLIRMELPPIKVTVNVTIL